MPFLLMLSIAFVPLIFGILTVLLFGKSKISFGLFLILLLISIWQLDITVLYGYNIISIEKIQFLFRLFRFGSVFVIPTLFYVTYILLKEIKLHEKTWLDWLINRFNVIIFYLWSVFVYVTGWMNKGVENLHLITGNNSVKFLFPTYGAWSWIFHLHLVFSILSIVCSFAMTAKIVDLSTRAFLRQFFSSATILFLIAIFNNSEQTVLDSSSIACLAFSVLIFVAVTRMNSKIIKNINSTLNQQKMFLRTIIDSDPNLIAVKDWNGKFIIANQSLADVYNTTIDNIIGKSESDFIHNEKEVWMTLSEDRKVMETLNTKLCSDKLIIDEQGSKRWMQTSKIPVILNNDRHILCISTDITKRKKDEESIYFNAHHDVLTSLPNRLLFNKQLGNSIIHAQNSGCMLAVLFLDLDRFKNINDTFGHSTGDQLLRLVAKRLMKCMKEGDIVSRLGGDEFIILLSNFNHIDDIIPVITMILGSFTTPFIVEGHELFTTSSIGISVFPHDGDNVENLIKNADVAMYRAKEQGKNNYQFYSPDMNASGPDRFLLENGLRKALAREEFILIYQPKVDILTGKIVGMEALLRWEHPKYGLVSPNQFIPLLEETGLIIPVGEWVLLTACRQTKKWQKEGLTSLRVGVNLSMRQFQDENLVGIIDKVLKETSLDPRYLELEITESIAMYKVNNVIMKLTELKNRGIAISIDDFGTGYSSLNYLNRFPVDTLKIDQSFIADITKESGNKGIIKAIITMSHSLNLNVIAEGVENELQLAFLREHGCDEIQGYLFSKPLTVDKFEELLVERRTVK
jgi:diguanylate cyclase (GGDEF)-like protein/PAS domain S-box-containing protein